MALTSKPSIFSILTQTILGNFFHKNNVGYYVWKYLIDQKGGTGLDSFFSDRTSEDKTCIICYQVDKLTIATNDLNTRVSFL